MFGEVKEKPACWDESKHLNEKWREAWAAWAQLRNISPSAKEKEKRWNAFVKADKELKAYVERVYG